jgi:DNA (cytosine-5)-methyltransferase 1
METVAFCEFDKKAQLVLKKHWPDVPIYDDVRKLNGRQFEGQSIDLICGGFPCQPFSQAGKRRGKEDDRHLWPEYFRLIQEIRPTWVLCENVIGLINMGLDQVLSDLEGENYSCQTFNIPACALYLNHWRQRFWILAYSLPGDRSLGGEHRRIRGELKQISQYKMGEIETSPRMVGNFDGLPGGLDRLKQLGNAVVPQVVEIIGRAIMQTEKGGR